MPSPSKTRLSSDQRRLLDRYWIDYERRGVVGVWAPLANAIKTALAEIDRHRRLARGPSIRKVRRRPKRTRKAVR